MLQQASLKKYKDLDQAMPCVVRVTDNSSSSHLPDRLIQEDLLLHSIVTHCKVICQCVDFVSKDGQLYFSNQRFSIPLGYTGWLEILSEDGKTISPIKTVEQVAEKVTEKFLVRSKVKAYLSDGNGQLDYDRTKTVEKGEVMTIVGRLSITHGWRRQRKQILHCLDSHEQNIYFDFKTPGQFSPIAGLTNISGVHSIEGIVSQFRLPLTVRIVSGQIPRVASHNDRPGVFRLLETQKDNTALFLPIISHQKLIPVSIRTNIYLTEASNMAEAQENQYYKQLLKLCNMKVEKYFRTMQVLVSAKQQQTDTYCAMTLPARSSKKSGSSKNHAFGPRSMNTEEDVLFAEVDDLYAYVRRGGVPPKPRPQSWATHIEDPNVFMTAEGKCSSQPILTTNGNNRGLLATLTAGRYPTKQRATMRQYKMPITPATPGQPTSQDPTEIPVGRTSDKIRSFIEKYHGSMESLQTEVDPYIEEGYYRNSTESIDSAKRLKAHARQPSVGELKAPRPRPLSTSLALMKTVSPAVSPTERKGFKTTISQLVIPKSKAHLLYRPSDTQFIENNEKFHQTVEAT